MSQRPRRRTQEERSADTQGRLLDATIDCVVELGYAGASTVAICQRAGVSRGAQLHHYPTRAKLVASAIERLFELRNREFRESLGARPDLPKALKRLWKIYTGKTYYAWAELLVAARSDPELRAQLREVDDQFFEQAKATCRQLLGGAAADEARVAAVARLTLSVLDGLALNHTLGGRDAQSRKVLAELGRVLGG
ncbi:MAG: TetR/AcrR family transcriptional regulator [Myxococcaceae bacterium]